MGKIIKQRRVFMILMIVFGFLLSCTVLLALNLSRAIDEYQKDEERLLSPPIHYYRIVVSNPLGLGVHDGEGYVLAKLEASELTTDVGEYILLRQDGKEPDIFDSEASSGAEPMFYVRVNTDKLRVTAFDIEPWLESDFIADNSDYFDGKNEYKYALIDMENDTDMIVPEHEYGHPPLNTSGLGTRLAKSMTVAIRAVDYCFMAIFGIAFVVFLILFIVFNVRFIRLK